MLKKANALRDSASQRGVVRRASDRSMPDVKDLAKRAQIAVSETEVSFRALSE
jgi:hypothetical protein